MKAAIVPQYVDELGQGRLFEVDKYDPTSAYGADRHAFARLHEEFTAAGDELYTVDQIDITAVDIVIFIDQNFSILRRCLSMDDPPRLAYIMREPPSVRSYNASSQLVRYLDVFDVIFTWNGQLADAHDGIFEYNIPQLLDVATSDVPSYDERDLLVNVSSRKYSSHPEELYSERERVIRFYDDKHPDKFNLYGLYWNKRPRIQDAYHYGVISPNKYQTYCGVVDDKLEAFSNHRFALAFENMTGIDGYLTEKLFDCLRAGCVPVYWGAQDIGDYLPKDIYVDYREFGTPEALHEYLSDVGVDAFRSYLEAARDFLCTEESQLSSSEYARTIHNRCQEIVSFGGSPSISGSLATEISQRSDIDELADSELGTVQSLRTLAGLLSENPALVKANPSAVRGILRGVIR